MARIETHAVPVERQWVTAADVVEAAAAHAGSALGRHRLAVDADDTIGVKVDPRLTSAALAHLLENAARYSPEGTTVTVHGAVTGVGLRLSVTDQGPGLRDEELERLFEPFVRGRAARGATTGTGLGLAITRGLLAAEGGRVWAERTPDAGARFTIEVPAQRRTDATQEARA